MVQLGCIWQPCPKVTEPVLIRPLVNFNKALTSTTFLFSLNYGIVILDFYFDIVPEQTTSVVKYIKNNLPAPYEQNQKKTHVLYLKANNISLSNEQ